MKSNNKNMSEKKISVNRHYLDDSETYENSTKYKYENSEKNNSITEDLNKNFKKSIGFLSKKMFIEKPEPNNRKYSMEEHLIIKDFVPHLKRIEIHLVPSKLCLNKKGYKNLKNNKLNSNNTFISCPNSEEENDIILSPINNSPLNNGENIKKTRKMLKKIKSDNIIKIMSRNIIESNCNIFKDDLKFEFDSEKDYLDFDDNILLYDDNDFINYNMTTFDARNSNESENKNNDENIKENEGENNVRNNRINSCSILDVLKNGISFDEIK